MSRQTPSERLLARLKAMGVPVDDDAAVTRTYAGHWQRREGAWTWLTGPVGERHVMAGSIHTVTNLARAPRLCAELSRHSPEWSIYPYDERSTQAASDTYLIEAR